MFDHGWEWVGKLRKLKKANLLPDAVLFAVKSPEMNDVERTATFNEVVTELKKNENVSVIMYDDANELLKFATEEK